MNTFFLLAVLAQVPTTPGAPRAAVELTQYSWSDGKRSFKLFESAVLVAEPAPTAERRDALLAAGASLVVDRPTMRVWKVTDARAVRGQVAALRPVFHDSRAGIGRYRVPLGLVCNGQRAEKPWLEVLQGSGASCLPDFWYPPVLR